MIKTCFTKEEIIQLLEEIQQKPCHNLVPGLLRFLEKLGIPKEELKKFQR